MVDLTKDIADVKDNNPLYLAVKRLNQNQSKSNFLSMFIRLAS